MGGGGGSSAAAVMTWVLLEVCAAPSQTAAGTRGDDSPAVHGCLTRSWQQQQQQAESAGTVATVSFCAAFRYRGGAAEHSGF